MSTEAAPATTTAEQVVDNTKQAEQKETASIVGSIKSAANKAEEEIKKGAEEIKKGAEEIKDEVKDVQGKISKSSESSSNPLKKVGAFFKKMFN